MDAWTPSVPPFWTIVWLGPVLVAWILGSGLVCGWLRLARGARIGDTRKLFHFLIFSSAAALSVFLGLPAVNLLGGLVGIYILFVVYRGEKNVFFEGIARPRDAPRRGFYVLVPFAATAVGGICATALFGPFATVGYAVNGWGDAVAEPIGVRFGKHRYRTPNLGGGIRSDRSLEGSAAVFIASALAAWLALELTDLAAELDIAGRLAVASVVAGISTVVEAASPHGADNLTLQITASGAAAWLC